MSTTTITIIVGAIFILLAIADSVKIQGNSLDLINNKLRIPLGGLGVLLIGFALYQTIQSDDVPEKENQESISNGSIKIDQKQEKMEILETSIKYPQNGDVVECFEIVKGLYPANLEKDIWVLLKPEDNRYYPQSEASLSATKKNEEWKVTCRFAGDKDENVQLIIYESNKSSSEFFSRTIENWNNKNDFPGLKYDEIPKDAEEVGSIVVTLKKSCRGVHEHKK